MRILGFSFFASQVYIYVRAYKSQAGFPPSSIFTSCATRSYASLFSSISIHLRRPRNARIPIRVPPNFHIFLLSFILGFWLCSLARLEALLEISNDIIDVFGADGDADEIFGDAGVSALGFGELFVGCGPGVDGEGFGVADAGKEGRLVSSGRVEREVAEEGMGMGDELGQVGNEFETIYDFAASCCAAFDTEG